MPKPRCDICGSRDGFQGLNLITCKVCGVHVHKECYGTGESINDDFTCWACRAVGVSFQVDERLPSGERRRILQKERPDRCELCSVRGGVHAMHPLFDYHGLGGRQIMCTNGPTGVEVEEPRLAWVHSLCAYFLAGKEGLVYGCGFDGFFVGQMEGGFKDDRSANSAVIAEDEDNEDDSVHHFAYNLQRPGQAPNAWTEAIKNHNDQDFCFICGLNDRHRKVLRIAMPCSANTEDEYELFKEKHIEMSTDEVCMVSMHIGCARWGESGSASVRRIYFFPGSHDENAEYNEPTLECYCDAHAAELIPPNKKFAATHRVQNHAKSSLAKPGRPVVSESRDKLIKRVASGSSAHQRKRSMSYRYSSKSSLSKAPASSVVPRMKMTELGPNQRGKFSHKRQMTAAMDKSIAEPVSRAERPLLARKRGDIANKANTPKKSELERMQEEASFDTMQYFTKLEEASPGDKAKRRQLMKSRRKFWTRKFNELPSHEFNSLWDAVKADIADFLIGSSSGDLPVPQHEDPAPSQNGGQEVIALMSDDEGGRKGRTVEKNKRGGDDDDSDDDSLFHSGDGNGQKKMESSEKSPPEHDAGDDTDSLFSHSDDETKGKREKGGGKSRVIDDDSDEDGLFDNCKTPFDGERPSDQTRGEPIHVGDDDSYDELFDGGLLNDEQTETADPQPVSDSVSKHDDGEHTDADSYSSGVDEHWSYESNNAEPPIVPNRWAQHAIGENYTGKKFKVAVWDSTKPA